MKIQKECITDSRRIDHSLSIISKITFVSSEEDERFSTLNRSIAENILSFCNKLDSSYDGIMGNVVALLTPAVTYMRNDIISIKYDFTVSSNGAIVYHKRFCVNFHCDLGIFLLPRFFKEAKMPRSSAAFYIMPCDDDSNSDSDSDRVVVVPVLRELERGMRVGRRSDIDAFCDGKNMTAKIKIPRCLTREKISHKSARKKKTKRSKSGKAV